MIQRIQSIYLVLAGIFSAFTCFVPVVSFVKTDQNISFYMSSTSYYANSQLNAIASEMTNRHPWGLAIMAIVAAIIAIAAIFSYNNRKQQLKWVNVATIVNIIWYIAFAAYTFSVKGRIAAELSFEVGCLFPLLSLLTLHLAKRAIKHDEALVRAADRIR